ncbi:acyltransferase [Pseudonocardia sp. GCM10023141]
MAPHAAAGTVRFPHVDNLRTVLVAWVIGGHALLGYSAAGGWSYDEIHEVTFTPGSELLLTAVVGPTGLFVIGLFFFLSGLLTEHAIDHHGPRDYVQDRTLRLGLPWLASALLVWPVSLWLAYRAAGRDVSPWWVFTHRDPLLDSGSLWFALVLLIFSVTFALWRSRAGAVSGDRNRPPLTGVHLAIAVVAVALVSFVVRLWFPARSAQVGDLHLWQWPQCAGMFALGVIAARRGWTRHVPDRIRRSCGIAAITTLLLLPVLAFASGLRDVVHGIAPYLGGWHWEALATATAEGILVVAGSVWLLGVAEHRLTGAGPRASRWARSAFAAFVLQGPVLLGLSVAVRSIDLPAEVKAPAVGVAAIMACFWLGRHVPFLGAAAWPGRPHQHGAAGRHRAGS